VEILPGKAAGASFFKKGLNESIKAKIRNYKPE